MNRYGSDKPDLRYKLYLKDFNEFADTGDFKVFKSVLENKGTVKAIVAPGCSSFSRKQISELEETAKIYGASGLAWMKVTEEGMEGGISKFYSSQADKIKIKLDAKPGDLILMVGSGWKKACTSLGAVRIKLAHILNLVSSDIFEFCWVTDFPLFEWNEDEKRWEAAHHMFTMPQEEYIKNLEEDPGSVKGDLYDLVCNGVELASGSIRIHDPGLQRRIFKIVGFSEEEAQKRFGFLLEALKYGPPPHGGIAPGLDRLIMLMAGESTIREVIAFPKNTQGVSLMDESPSEVDDEQLKELHLKVVRE